MDGRVVVGSALDKLRLCRTERYRRILGILEINSVEGRGLPNVPERRVRRNARYQDSRSPEQTAAFLASPIRVWHSGYA